jgi:hypothetical protein
LHTAIDLPVLSTKSFFYSTGRLGWGTPLQGGSIKDITIPEAYRNHPVFTGVTLTDGKLTGVSSQPITLNAAYAGSTLGEADNASSGRGTSIHELTADQRFGAGSGKKSGYLLISLMNAEFASIGDNVVKLYDNAAAYLMSAPAPNAVPDVNALYLKFDGQKVLNPENKSLKLFNVSGSMLMETRNEIDMNIYGKGIYVVKSGDGEVLKLMR